MTTTYAIEELWDSQKGDGDFKQKREYNRKFEVQTSNQFDGPVNISAAFTLTTGIGIGTSYDTGESGEVDLGSVATNVIANRIDLFLWEVEVPYNSVLDFGGATHGDHPPKAKSPKDRVPVWSFDFALETKAFEKDLDNKDLCNSAGDPFDPPFEWEVGLWCIKIKKNFQPSDLSPGWFVDRWRHYNSDVWSIGGYTFDIASMIIWDLKATSQYENAEAFYEVEYTIVMKPAILDGDSNVVGGLWHPWRIADRGFNTYEADVDGEGNASKLKIRDFWGDPITTPAFLDGAGQKAAGNPPTVTYLLFRRYDGFVFTDVVP